VWSGGERPWAGLLKGRRDAVSDTSDFVDEELTDLADEISAFRVIMDDLLPAVKFYVYSKLVVEVCISFCVVCC